MNENQLKKILGTLLMEEFPDIEKIMVEPTDEASIFSPKVYIVYIGIKPTGITSRMAREIQERANFFSKIVLSKKEKVYIRFFNPLT